MRVLLGIALTSLVAVAPAAAQEARATDSSPDHPARITGAFELGYSAQSLFGAWTNGVGFDGFVGVDVGSFDVSVLELEVVPGRTDGGLSTLTISGGFMIEGRLGRLRIGGGLRAGWFGVNRVTTSGDLATATAGIFGRFSVDVVQFDELDEGALFVVVKPGVDTLFTAPLYGGTVGVGIRL